MLNKIVNSPSKLLQMINYEKTLSKFGTLTQIPSALYTIIMTDTLLKHDINKHMQ